MNTLLILFWPCAYLVFGILVCLPDRWWVRRRKAAGPPVSEKEGS